MAFQNSDLDISLYFDLDNTRLRIQDNSDYAGASPAISTADVVGVYKLTDPNSNILHENVNFNSPDVDIDVSLFSPYVTFTVTDGIYTAIYSVYDSDTATTYSKTFTFTYAASNTPTVVLDVESDVGLATISSTDETAYTSEVTLNARTHTLTYPASWGSTVSTSLVVDSISLTELYTGEYVSTISSDITITQTDDLIIDTTITGEEDHSVWDTDGMYTVRAALNTFYARWQDDKINNPDEGRREEYIWTEINANYTLYNTYKQNGDIENAGVYLNNIQALLAAEGIDTTVDPSTSVPVTQVIPGYASQWLNGTGVPDPSLGRNGDYYYRQDTGHVYTKSIGAWSDIGLIYSNTTVDGVTLEIVDGDIQIKDDGVTGAKLAPAVAGNGLKQNGSGNLGIEPGDFAGDGLSDDGSDNLEVNVDGLTIEINSNVLRVKDSGITNAKLANDGISITGGKAITSSKEDTVLGETTTVKVNTDEISVKVSAGDKLYTAINTYIAYADDKDGNGYTTTFDETKEYTGVIHTTTPIDGVVVGDYDGLWFRTIKHGSAFSFDNLGYLDTAELAGVTNAWPAGLGPITYHYKGTYNRMYMVFFSGRRDAAGNVRVGKEVRTWITYYDLDKKSFGEMVTLPELFPDSDDLHNAPQIIVTDSGHILVTKEALNGGVHNSPLEIWKSDNVEDITSFTKVISLWSNLGYTEIYKLAENTVYLHCRERIGGEERYRVMFKSVDNGSTWTDLEGNPNVRTIIMDYDTAGYFTYSRFMIAQRERGISIVLNPDIGITGNTESACFLHSDDGITWVNARQFVEGSGGFSHNVLTSGELTRTIVDTNYNVVPAIADAVNNSLTANHGCVDQNGVPWLWSYYAVNTDTVRANYLSDFKIHYYDVTTHAWISKDILSKLIRSNSDTGYLLYPFGTKIIAYEGGRFDLICQMSKNVNNMLVDEVVINSGTLKIGVYYRVITTDGGFDAAVGIGDIIRGKATFVPDATNTVTPIQPSYFVFRSEDYGESFSYIDLDSKYTGMGAAGEYTFNNNCFDTRQLFFGCQTGESVSETVIEYSNLAYFLSKIE